MQAIRTRYHGPGNVRGSRFSAQCGAGRVYVSYDDALDSEKNHEAAMRAMCAKLGWDADAMVGGVFENDYYWIFV